MNDLQPTVSSPGGTAEGGVVAGAVDGPPVILAVEDAFKSLYRTQAAKQVHQLIPIEALVAMEDPAAGPLSLAAVFQTNGLTGQGGLSDLDDWLSAHGCSQRDHHGSLFLMLAMAL